MKRAVILIDHGSKRSGASSGMKKILRSLSKRNPETRFHPAFLEIERLGLPQAIRNSVLSGAEEIVVVPYFLQGEKHICEHIPQMVRQARLKHPKMNILLSEHMNFDERLVGLV